MIPGTVIEQKHVVLTGFMGTGKSTVGRILADLLGRVWVDTDHLIESRHGPISSLFENLGEDHFRSLEREVAVELAAQTGLVVSTGGRMMLDPEVQKSLLPVSRVFCLVATPANILRRVGGHDGESQRPLLVGEDPQRRISDLLRDRAEGYAAFEAVETDQGTPRQVAEAIAEILIPGHDQRTVKARQANADPTE